MESVSATPTLPRIPPAVNGIQVNFCKNPRCRNFARPASEQRQPRGRGASSAPDRDVYTVVAVGKSTPALKCHSCEEILTIKSNLGISEELQRMTAAAERPAASCPHDDCQNYRVDIRISPREYIAHGKTAKSDRYLCKRCRRAFCVPRTALRWQTHSYKNAIVFKLLVHKTPLAGICEVAELSYSSLYRKIDFFWRQCRAFAAEREQALADLEIEKLNISVDRQDYTVNWAVSSIKENVVLNGLGSADNTSSYVFAMHLNYDPELNRFATDAAADACGDAALPAPFRRYARLWLTRDHDAGLGSEKVEFARKEEVPDRIKRKYHRTAKREDVEIPDGESPGRQLPSHGMQVHSEYTLYAHFLFLSRLLRGVKKVNFYLDQESGIRAACMAAFGGRILAKEVDAFYVTINKEMDIHSKRRKKAEERKKLNAFVDEHPYLSELAQHDIRSFYLKEHLYDLVPMGPWKDPWLMYPFPSMSEPEKAVCYLTNLVKKGYDHDDDTMTELYLDASLHGIDRFFMQLRRRLSILERPFATASRAYRTWYAYSAYNPELIVKLLEIYRVYYNYVKKGGDGKTPAQRLGLARGPVRVEDIIYFNPLAPL